MPRGFTDAKHAWTTDVAPMFGATTEMGGHNSSTALRLWDKWTDDNATATRLTEPADHQRVSFDWGVGDFRTSFVAGFKGRAGDEDTTPWRIRIVNGTQQTVQAYDGTTWTTLGTLTKKLAMYDWVPITMDATTSELTVTISGQAFTTTTRAQDANALSGLVLSTGDPIEYGGAFFVDNLAIGS